MAGVFKLCEGNLAGKKLIILSSLQDDTTKWPGASPTEDKNKTCFNRGRMYINPVGES